MKKKQQLGVITTVLMILLGILCLIPFLLIFSVSLSENGRLMKEGYNVIPVGLDVSAFTYVIQRGSAILKSVGISAFVTVVGTFCGVMMALMFAYPMTRKGYPLARFMTIFILIPMLFSGGLVPQYILYTQGLKIKNTIFALLLPNLLVSSYNIIVMRTFIKSGIPDDILDAASIDGASEGKIFLRIVLPLAKPIIGTTGLMTGMAYYNDWTNGLYYITDSKLFSLQNLLNRMLTNIQFLQQNSEQLANQAGQALAELPTANIRMALAVVGLIPVFLAFPFIHKAMIGGLTVGALKG